MTQIQNLHIIAALRIAGERADVSWYARTYKTTEEHIRALIEVVREEQQVVA